MSESAAASLPPPSSDIVNLAIADLVIYAVLFFPTCWITWKHGKNGMVCWPIFVSYFGLRFASDAYLIAHRADPLLPNTVAIMTNAGSLACLSLTIIGMLYEVYVANSRPHVTSTWNWTNISLETLRCLSLVAGPRRSFSASPTCATRLASAWRPMAARRAPPAKAA